MKIKIKLTFSGKKHIAYKNATLVLLKCTNLKFKRMKHSKLSHNNQIVLFHTIF